MWLAAIEINLLKDRLTEFAPEDQKQGWYWMLIQLKQECWQADTISLYLIQIRKTGKERKHPKMSEHYTPEQTELQQNLMLYSVNRMAKCGKRS